VKGLDSNVLVRYLTWDDAEQADRAAAVIDSAIQAGDPLFVSAVVVCELVWVLESAYGLPRGEVLDTVETVLRAAQLDFDDKDVLWQALADARGGAGDFSDYVIGRRAAAAGCDHTVTFDRVLEGSPLFEVL